MAALLVAVLSLEEVFASLSDLLDTLVEATVVEVALRRGSSGWVRLRYDRMRVERSAVEELDANDPCAGAVRNGTTLIGSDPAAYTIPLCLADEIVGAFSVRSDALPAYDDDERALIASIAPYVAVAVRQRMLLNTVARERFLAQHDALTGLANRDLFASRLEQALSRAQRSRRAVGVLYLDLDAFKPVNDLHGHDAGDAVLRAVARRLRRSVRESDTVARVGGDEFAAILEDVRDEDEVQSVAGKILKSLARPVGWKDVRMHIGASIGWSLAPRDGSDVETLVQAADQAMYRVKRTRLRTRQAR